MKDHEHVFCRCMEHGGKCSICGFDRWAEKKETTTNPSTTDWEKEFDSRFTNGYYEIHQSYVDGAGPAESRVLYSGDIKDFIRTLLSRKEEEVREREWDRIRTEIGMTDGVYFYKPEEGFNGSVQYIPKHTAMNISDPRKEIAADGNNVIPTH